MVLRGAGHVAPIVERDGVSECRCTALGGPNLHPWLHAEGDVMRCCPTPSRPTRRVWVEWMGWKCAPRFQVARPARAPRRGTHQGVALGQEHPTCVAGRGRTGRPCRRDEGQPCLGGVDPANGRQAWTRLKRSKPREGGAMRRPHPPMDLGRAACPLGPSLVCVDRHGRGTAPWAQNAESRFYALDHPAGALSRALRDHAWPRP